jgi:hypothetical protein
MYPGDIPAKTLLNPGSQIKGGQYANLGRLVNFFDSALNTCMRSPEFANAWHSEAPQGILYPASATDNA